MSVLIAIAFKSLLIGGLTLGLLHLMRKRSAAERSWVAHAGLVALMVMALAPLVLPSWKVETPAMFGRAETSAAIATAVAATPAQSAIIARAQGAAPFVAATRPPPLRRSSVTLDPIAAAIALYAVPAAVLLFITFLALARLIALQARAEVLVDGHWLSALARAQRRMGFKHGTALLTSNELTSPISWGLIRPVILLNSRAVEATKEAEAIIAHELAHVARLDWIKLLLARFATACFWFNPLVWLLAREAHQLREEAADDSVLAADIADTDYAQLLVGVARHECPGLLLGAHGVAPSKSSLGRRVARVLDGQSARGPAARGFALGVFTGAVLVAAPLAALTLAPASPKAAPAPAAVDHASKVSAAGTVETPRSDLPHLIAQGVATSVTTAMAAASSARAEPDVVDRQEIQREAALEAAEAARDAQKDARDEARDAQHEVRNAVREAQHEARDAVREAQRASHGDARTRLRDMGVTDEYVGAMRAASPALANLEFSEFAGMRVVGVTPEFARSLAAAGFPRISSEELIQARTIGVTGDYVRAMRAAGVSGDMDDFVQLRAVGVDPAFAARVKHSGASSMSADDLVEARAAGYARVPTPPVPPHVPSWRWWHNPRVNSDPAN